MKKILGILLTLGLIGCQKENPVVFETLTQSLNNDIAEINVQVAYPQKAEALNNLRKQIADLLIPNYQGNLADGNALLKEFAEDKNNEMIKAMSEFGGDTSFKALYIVSIKEVAQTSQFVTIEKDAYIYTGGAHGVSEWDAITLKKSDGKQLDNILNSKVNSVKFKNLLKQGVVAYFTQLKGAVDKCEFQPMAVQNELFEDFSANDLPLPEQKPFLTDKGVGFVYMPYEISWYSNGRIAFILPYSEMKNYLREDVLKLLPKEDDNKIEAYTNEKTQAEYQKYLTQPEHKICQ